MEYIVHSLGQIILILGLANIMLLLVPRSIRKAFKGVFKIAYKIVLFTTTQSIKIVKNIYANNKEIEQPKKRKYSSKKDTNSKVIQFPKENVK